MESQNIPKGIFCIIFSSFSFALMGFFVHLSGDIPFVQKAFFRNFVALIIALLLLLKDRKNICVPKSSIKWLLLRSIAGTLGIFCNFYALDKIPLADAAILNKMSPFFAVLFSFIILDEKIKLIPFLCILGAFSGAVFVIKPSADIFTSFPSLIAFTGGLGAGLAYSCVRKLKSLNCSGNVIIVFFSAFSCLISLPFLILNFSSMTFRQFLILCASGISAAGGQFGITNAYYYAAPRDISVYDYSQIIFSALLGLIFFHQIPDIYSFFGYGIIILMAVLVFFYNKKKTKISKEKESCNCEKIEESD